MAGMLAYCDFQEQDGCVPMTGGAPRPGGEAAGGKSPIVVDSKDPAGELLRRSPRPTRASAAAAAGLRQAGARPRHRASAAHVLGSVRRTPELMVMSACPAITSTAPRCRRIRRCRRVRRGPEVLMTRGTVKLIGLLRAIAYGWRTGGDRRQRQGGSADLGAELLKRLRPRRGLSIELGRDLRRAAVESFDDGLEAGGPASW